MQPIDQSACKKESGQFRMTDNFVINIDGFHVRAQNKSINRAINTTFLSIFNSSVHAAKIAVCSHKLLIYLFPLNTLNVNRDNVNKNVENKSIREIQIPNAEMVKSTT